MVAVARDDAAHCQAIVRTHAKTFYLASRLLPAAKRRAAYAVYAFCRIADDLADKSTDTRTARPELERLQHALKQAMDGHPDGPVFRELTEATTTFRIPAVLLDELLEGVMRDCRPVEPADWAELERYCQGVASSVGEMCTHIFGVSGDDATHAVARSRARTLGVAMQLTNILRDVGEDAANGRCYLPVSDLATFGLSRDEVLRANVGQEPRWRALMEFEIARARKLYEQALPGIALLSADSRRCAAACALGYAGILDAIEQIGYDTFRTRARLSSRARAVVLWNAWCAPSSTPDLLRAFSA